MYLRLCMNLIVNHCVLYRSTTSYSLMAVFFLFFCYHSTKAQKKPNKKLHKLKGMFDNLLFNMQIVAT